MLRGKGAQYGAKPGEEPLLQEFQIIPAVLLSDDEKEAVAKTMIAGNVVLKELHKQAKANGAKEKTRYARQHFRKELFKHFDDVARRKGNRKYTTVLHGVKISESDCQLILAVRAIEYKVLQSISKLIANLANRWNKRTNIPFEDVYNEALLSAINSVYCFTKSKQGKKVKFATFVTHAVTRRIMNMNRTEKPLSHWTNDESQLFAKYEKTRQTTEQSLNNEGKPRGPVSFDDLMRIMKVDEDERNALQKMLTGVIRQSDMVNTGEENKGNYDYTAAAKQSRPDEPSVLDDAQKAALAAAQLDEWEKAVLQAYLNAPEGTGWKTEIAKRHINPKTNRHYSRPAPEIALRRIRKKVLKIYNGQKAA
jgi:DNA-directed RNA polymerase specialized sigma subunit